VPGIQPFKTPTHFEHDVPRTIGPFRVTPWRVDHSAYDAYSLLIEAGGRRLLFLVHCARLAFGPTHVEHGTAEREGAHLLRSISRPGARLGRLKPDILVRDSSGALVAVIDAKYKRLRSWRGSPSGVDRGDLYQLTSYLSGHDVPLGVLAYPPHDTDDASADLDGPWLTRAGQETRFVRIPATATDATAALGALVGGSAGPRALTSLIGR
jgi:5-methylcytosine-specific restriction enzyme subunit McrC